MHRSRAFSLFGWFLTLLLVATVTVHSHAADRTRLRSAAFVLDATIPPEGLHLLPPLSLNADPALFGSLVRSAPTTGRLPSGVACPSEMVEVEGDYCPYVEQKCRRWLDPATKLQCAEFDKAASPNKCSVPAQHKHFCMDRYEWPNKAGSMPVYMTSWYEAKSSCEAAHKRLCSDTEWTLSCEGEDMRPYPYGDGYARDQSACNIDKPYILPNAQRIFDAKTSSDELARLDQREPSGARAACVSPYGAHDMVGNVDEWVVNVSQAGKPYQSGLKGGYWGPVRTRCRPMTTAHNETFRYYQIGFRCCAEATTVAMTESPLAGR